MATTKIKPNKHILITVLVALLAVGVGFFGGVHYQKAQRPDFMMGKMMEGERGQGMSTFQRGEKSTMFMGRPVNGEIISQDDKSITVKMPDGSTKIVILSDKTTINKSSEGATTDLKTGERVTAFGKENSDGSITADVISLGGGMFRTMQKETESK